MSALRDILGLGGGAGLLYGAYDKLGDAGNEARNAAMGIANQTAGMAGFKPYGVTSNIGTGQVGQDGSLSLSLSPEQEQMMSQLMQGASGMFSNATADTAAREQDVYDRIRAVQQPGEERNALALEERLNSQGRLGVRTNMFGGTPEQFAMEKANAEARNQAALSAITQAQAEQMQSARIGDSMFRSSYLPIANLGNVQQLGNQSGQMANTAGQNAASLFGQAAMSGIEADIGAALGQANLMGNLGSGLLTGMLQPQYNQQTGELLNPVLDWLGI